MYKQRSKKFIHGFYKSSNDLFRTQHLILPEKSTEDKHTYISSSSTSNPVIYELSYVLFTFTSMKPRLACFRCGS